jgi:predicted nucleic acid-binding protein
MRACLDSNILIKGLAGTGRAALALDLTLRFANLICSDYILREVEKNLPKVGVSKETAKLLANNLRDAAEVVIPAQFKMVVTNEKDDPVLGTAVAGQCDFLVTNDIGIFKRRRRFFGTGIASLDHYLSIFEGLRRTPKR